MMDLVGSSCCRLSVSLNWWILGFTLWGLAIFVVFGQSGYLIFEEIKIRFLFFQEFSSFHCLKLLNTNVQQIH